MEPTQRFTGLADIYNLARPSYPPQAIEFIRTTVAPLPDSVVVDVGCGTGISTRIFATFGCRVIGLEPNADMREKAVSESTSFDNIEYVNGSAEATRLAEASIDAVLAAQAFHWFDQPAALREFHRILKPQCWVVLMWNERCENNELTRGYGDALRTLPETAKVEMKRGIAGQPLLDDASWMSRKKKTFENSQIVTKEGFLKRAFSASYVPQQGPSADELRSELERLFDRCCVDGTAEMLYETSVYVAQQPPVT